MFAQTSESVSCREIEKYAKYYSEDMTMGEAGANRGLRNVTIVPMPHAISQDGFFAVDSKWGITLKRRLATTTEEYVFFSPRDFSYTKDKYPIVFDKGERVHFYSLYNWANTISDADIGLIPRLGRLMTFARQLPCITWRLWKEMPNWDSMLSTAVPYPPIGILANIIGYIRRKKRTFWIDTDIEGFWEWQIKSVPIHKALLLKSIQLVYSAFVRFCVHTSQLTWASGDDVLARYRNSGNVVVLGWTPPQGEDAISSIQLAEKVAKIQKGNLKLMTASSLYPMKGVQYAVEAARILIKEMGVPATLDIYGDGHMRSALEHLVEQYGLADTVHFKGTVPYGDQFFACVREHDCVLIPDLPGPLSRTLFDALAQGTAVVASDTDAYRGVVSDGWDALLVPPGNPVAIAAAVQRLHQDRKLLGEIIRKGAETAKRYTIEPAS
jgi:glycosyltransferase involved in cell wall biosynthesis